MKVHLLKTDKKYFEPIRIGLKTFELRKDDRGYMGGDVVVLQEFDWQRQEPTGRFLVRQIGYILRGPLCFAPDPEEVALGKDYIIFQLVELGKGGGGLLKGY